MINLSQDITITTFQLIFIIAVAIFSAILLLYLITFLKGLSRNYICKFAYIPKNIWPDVKLEAKSKKLKTPNYLGSVIYHSHIKQKQMKKRFTYYKQNR